MSLATVLKKMDVHASRIDQLTDKADPERLQRALQKLINYAYNDAQHGKVNAAFELLDKIERALQTKDGR